MKDAEARRFRVRDPVPVALVDAFADGPFTGNPAGVCLLDAPVPDRWMADVAAEIRAPETAFVLRRDDQWLLRWFTPTLEVDLCGHATLAAAHLLLASGEATTFATRSGLLGARRRPDGQIALDFPRIGVRQVPVERSLRDALGVAPRWAGRTVDDLVCVLESPAAVERARPQMDALERLAPRGVAISAEGGRDADITSRFFAPAAGVPEDPVTGSVHCALGPFWCGWLGQGHLRARQASARGGVLGLGLAPNDRVELMGAATTVLSGSVIGPPDESGPRGAGNGGDTAALSSRHRGP